MQVILVKFEKKKRRDVEQVTGEYRTVVLTRTNSTEHTVIRFT